MAPKHSHAVADEVHPHHTIMSPDPTPTPDDYPGTEAATPAPSTSPAPSATPTIKLQIASLPITLPVPYTTGHVLTQVEAQVLNQTFAENVRNNQAGKVKDAITAGGGSLTEEAAFALTEAILAYASTYTFAGPRAPRVSVDPIEHEARKLARTAILAGLSGIGKTAKDYTKDYLEAKVTELLTHKPTYRKVAAERIAALSSIATEGLEDLLA